MQKAIHNPLVFSLIAPYLQPSNRPAARLACSNLRDALDSDVSTAIAKIRIGQWELLHVPNTLQHSIRHLEAHIDNARDWAALLEFLQHLPTLRSLCCTGRRTWPPQRPQGSKAVTPHSQLRVVRFEGTLNSLVELSALTPNLESLCCGTLAVLSDAMAGNRRRSATGSLPSCQCLTAGVVSITATDEAEAGASFAAALPQLQVLAHTPAFCLAMPAGFTTSHFVLPLQQALRCCGNLRAVRTFGSRTDMGGILSPQLQTVPRLQCLSVYGVGPAVELLGIDKVMQLEALSLTFQLPDKRAGTKLLSQLGALPRLRLLALPAKILCSKCSPGAKQHLEALLLQDDSNNAIIGSSGSVNTGQDGSHSAGGAGLFPQLQQLVFLGRAQEGHGCRQSGDFCKHNTEGELQALASEFAAAVQRSESAQHSSTATAAAAELSRCSAALVCLNQRPWQQFDVAQIGAAEQLPETQLEGCHERGLRVEFVQLGLVPRPCRTAADMRVRLT